MFFSLSTVYLERSSTLRSTASIFPPKESRLLTQLLHGRLDDLAQSLQPQEGLPEREHRTCRTTAAALHSDAQQGG